MTDELQAQCPGDQVWTEVGCIHHPKLLSRKDPKYPKSARREGLEGTVTLLAVLQKDGKVGEIRVKKSSPAGVGFEESAIKAVRKWRYEPALYKGMPISIWFTVNVHFDLEGDAK